MIYSRSYGDIGEDTVDDLMCDEYEEVAELMATIEEEDYEDDFYDISKRLVEYSDPYIPDLYPKEDEEDYDYERFNQEDDDFEDLFCDGACYDGSCYDDLDYQEHDLFNCDDDHQI